MDVHLGTEYQQMCGTTKVKHAKLCCTVRDKLKQQGNRVSVQLTFYNAIDKMTINRTCWCYKLHAYKTFLAMLSLMAHPHVFQILRHPPQSRERNHVTVRASWKIKPNLLKFVIWGLWKSSPSLSILVPSWFTITSQVLSYARQRLF